jgi:hypothetical protein
MKRSSQVKSRERFCKLAMSRPKEAAEQLRVMATGLENCRNTSDTIRALCEIFAVSERTVFNDLVK